jgi:hypothetical protein
MKNTNSFHANVMIRHSKNYIRSL